MRIKFKEISCKLKPSIKDCRKFSSQRSINLDKLIDLRLDTKSGLAKNEQALCQQLVHIPIVSDMDSLNTDGRWQFTSL